MAAAINIGEVIVRFVFGEAIRCCYFFYSGAVCDHQYHEILQSCSLEVITARAGLRADFIDRAVILSDCEGSAVLFGYPNRANVIRPYKNGMSAISTSPRAWFDAPSADEVETLKVHHTGQQKRENRCSKYQSGTGGLINIWYHDSKCQKEGNATYFPKFTE